MAWCNDHSFRTSYMGWTLSFLNAAALSNLPSLKVFHLTRHCPLLLKVHDPPTGTKLFIFLKMWASHNDFVSFVSSTWSINLAATPLLVQNEKF